MTDKATPSPASVDRIIASLCGDVEPVAWLHIQGAHTEAADRELWDDERKRGWTQEPLCHASTVAALKADAKQSEKHRNDLADANTDLRTQVAALKARVAELEKDAARLEFVCNSPNRMVERESGLWRVYEDVAPTDHPTSVWQGMTPRWHVTPREAIDAAITAALTKGQP